MLIKMLTGNQAAAFAAMNSMVRFVAAYPITPATPVIETISKLVEEGIMEAKFVPVESEHSAMAACIGASAAGLRTFTATSSHGLAYMHEMLHWAVNARTPVVMVVANRAIGPGWNIWSDLSDSLSQRDTGWLQFYCSSVQEIYDTIAMSYRVAEDVMVPAMVCYDGFVLSHTSVPVEITPLEGFINEYQPKWRISIEKPLTHGNILPPDAYISLRKAIHKAHRKALELIPEIEEEFFDHTGRSTPMLYETYRFEDAEEVLVAVGAVASEARIAVDILRSAGVKVGLLRLKSFRPFPSQIRRTLGDRKVTVIDRDFIPGVGGIVYQEISNLVQSDSMILGVGGADVTAEMIAEAFTKLVEV